jgi:hypothetical protein
VFPNGRTGRFRKFSCTVIVEKIIRPCGTKASPLATRAWLFGARSVPSSMMLPAHTGIMPISVHERGLAHAIATDEDDDFTPRHAEIESVECLALAVTRAEA